MAPCTAYAKWLTLLPLQVYYAKSCYASTADMTIGMLKYTYDVVNSAELGMQLFVSSGAALQKHTVGGHMGSRCLACLLSHRVTLHWVACE